MSDRPTRLLITGGGTGGHVYPGLAVAEALGELAPDIEVVFMGTARGLEGRVVPQAGYRLLTVPASGFRGLGPVARAAFVLNTAAGTAKALVAMLRHRPGVVLGTGGYASVPALTAALLLGIPCAIQEQNSVPGSANRLLGRRMRRIYLGFAGARSWFPSLRCRLTGNPVRRAVREAAASAVEEPGAGQDRNIRRVLIFGGSRGARTLNRAVMGAAGTWGRNPDLRLMVQTGTADLEEVRAACTGCDNIAVTPYIEDMAAALRAADLVVCRAGAMTLAEIQCAGKPAILVPYPHATDDHQLRNAEECAAAGAAVILKDDDCTATNLAARVEEILREGSRLAKMGEAARALARPEAAVRIAADLLALAGHPAGRVLADDT